MLKKFFGDDDDDDLMLEALLAAQQKKKQRKQKKKANVFGTIVLLALIIGVFSLLSGIGGMGNSEADCGNRLGDNDIFDIDIIVNVGADAEANTGSPTMNSPEECNTGPSAGSDGGQTQILKSGPFSSLKAAMQRGINPDAIANFLMWLAIIGAVVAFVYFLFIRPRQVEKANNGDYGSR